MPLPEASQSKTQAPQHSDDQKSQSLRHGVEWLVQQQAADGGWHSATYGQMQGGVGNTALVVYALAQLPDSLQSSVQKPLSRGIDFLVANLEAPAEERLRASADYPTYAMALLLSAMHRLEDRGWPEQRSRLRDELIAAQQRQKQGWTEDDSGFGGWNQTGGGIGDARRSGNTNISVTCSALQALGATGTLNDDATSAALKFLARCQNLGATTTNDGGFFFTPAADDPLNKAGTIETAGESVRARSYGTTTADGLCALVASGVPKDDPRVRAALAWFDRHDSIDIVPGFSADESHGSSAAEGLKFYYYAALARVARECPDAMTSERRSKLLAAIVEQQRPDGSWRNACTLMREDDPLIATALAVAAMSP